MKLIAILCLTIILAIPIHYVVASMNEISVPLKQNWIPTNISGIKCKDGFQLIGKRENGSPACVMPATFVKLIALKWGFDPFQDGWSFNGLNNSYQESHGILFTVQFKGFSIPFCYLPIITLKDVNGKPLWTTGEGLYLCKAYTKKDGHYFEQNETINMPAINQTGSYTIIASWQPDQFIVMQKNITVTSYNIAYPFQIPRN